MSGVQCKPQDILKILVTIIIFNESGALNTYTLVYTAPTTHKWHKKTKYGKQNNM